MKSSYTPYLLILKREPYTIDKWIEIWRSRYDTYLRHNFFERGKLLGPSGLLSEIQLKRFARHFYHVRGHFSDFVWVAGSHSTSTRHKEIVLENIASEFGGELNSHEELYLQFTEAVGATDCQQFQQPRYLQKYNQAHLDYLRSLSCADIRFAAFAAYEALDNIDYARLVDFGKRHNLPENAMTFFEIHAEVEHFNEIFEELKKIEQKYPQEVRQAFHFIGNHQLRMWGKLGTRIGLGPIR